MDVAFSHPIKLIANALGVPPQSMIDRGRAQGVPVAALVGAKEHAIRQVQAGVDIIVAEGAEAGGHTAKSRRSCWSPKSFAPFSRSAPCRCSPRAA